MDLLRWFLKVQQQSDLYLYINPLQLNCPLQYPNQFLKPRHVIGIIFICRAQLGLIHIWQFPFVGVLDALQLSIILIQQVFYIFHRRRNIRVSFYDSCIFPVWHLEWFNVGTQVSSWWPVLVVFDVKFQSNILHYTFRWVANWQYIIHKNNKYILTFRSVLPPVPFNVHIGVNLCWFEVEVLFNYFLEHWSPRRTWIIEYI